MSTISHITGPVIEINDRIIQRCPWCGTKLYDSLNAITLKGVKKGTWPIGRVIRIYEFHTDVIPESDTLPSDICLELVE